MARERGSAVLINVSQASAASFSLRAGAAFIYIKREGIFGCQGTRSISGFIRGVNYLRRKVGQRRPFFVYIFGGSWHRCPLCIFFFSMGGVKVVGSVRNRFSFGKVVESFLSFGGCTFMEQM